jgi:hypothetical protein
MEMARILYTRQTYPRSARSPQGYADGTVCMYKTTMGAPLPRPFTSMSCSHANNIVFTRPLRVAFQHPLCVSGASALSLWRVLHGAPATPAFSSR